MSTSALRAPHPACRSERTGATVHGVTDNWVGGHLNDGAWWWGTALDGVVGGLVGGFFTALAVVMTIRHERESQIRASAHNSASGLVVASILLPAKVATGTVHDQAEAVQEIIARSIDLTSQLSSRWPSVAVELQRKVDNLIGTWTAIEAARTFASDPVARAVSGVVIVANTWMMDRPKSEGRRTRSRALTQATAWLRQ